MGTDKTRYKANIAGSTYTIIGTETKEHMDIVTQLVNDQLKEIRHLTPEASVEQTAILAAINAVNDQLKKQEQILTLQKELNELRPVAERAEELEAKVTRIEQMEQEAKEALKKTGYEEALVTNHVDAQQVLNASAKKKIREKNGQPKTAFEAKQEKSEV
ncbi:MAG: cell division protein ZapA [Lactobacillales bacterium]|jgi:cell division protein ZapA|nr:cell division protein ZapA [Lactobacillales bacterium]